MAEVEQSSLQELTHNGQENMEDSVPDMDVVITDKEKSRSSYLTVSTYVLM